jgi:phosphoribosylamine--glycine ligase
VVAAAADYPRAGSRGAEIKGIEEARRQGAIVFHAGTARDGDRLVTAGGRVLDVVGVGESPQAARDAAYRGLEALRFDGMRYRRDIGGSAIPAERRNG